MALNLRVEIIDAYGVCLYSNVIPNSDLHAQVIIIRNSSDTAHENEAKALTKVWIKSYGSALVKVRCNFSDQAQWIGAALTKL
jgi:hypothetical protein